MVRTTRGTYKKRIKSEEEISRIQQDNAKMNFELRSVGLSPYSKSKLKK